MRRRGHLPAVAAALLAGCAVSPPEIRTYHFETVPLERALSPSGASLALGPFAASAHLHSSSLAARTSEVSIEYYATHRWAAPIEEFVPLAIARGLRSSGAFREVSLGGNDEPRLEGTILAFEEADREDGWWGVVELDLRIVRGGSSLWSGSVRAERPARDRHPAFVVEAIRAALGEAMSRALPGMQAAAGEPPSAGNSAPE